MDIGTTIKMYRKRKKITQEELAEVIGISKSTLAKYEQSQRQPNLEMLNTIASSLDMTSNALIATANLKDDKFGEFWFYINEIKPYYEENRNNKIISNINDKINSTGVLSSEDMENISIYNAARCENKFIKGSTIENDSVKNNVDILEYKTKIENKVNTQLDSLKCFVETIVSEFEEVPADKIKDFSFIVASWISEYVEMTARAKIQELIEKYSREDDK